MERPARTRTHAPTHTITPSHHHTITPSHRTQSPLHAFTPSPYGPAFAKDRGVLRPIGRGALPDDDGGMGMVIGKLLRRNRILGDREAELRARERELLDRLGAALDRFGTDVDPDDL